MQKGHNFLKNRVAFCSPIFQQYIGMVLLPQNYASDRKISILRKGMKIKVTSKDGNDCDFKFYSALYQSGCLTWVETEFENVSKFTANSGPIKTDGFLLSVSII